MINDILPPDAFIWDVVRIVAAITLIVVCYGYRHEIRAFLRALGLRYVALPTLADVADIPVSAHQDAVKENAENGKAPALVPAELDRMLRDAADERAARVVGRLAGLGIIPDGQRARALIEAGLEGRRYQRWKDAANESQVAAQAAAEPAPAAPDPEPRIIHVNVRPAPAPAPAGDDVGFRPPDLSIPDPGRMEPMQA